MGTIGATGTRRYRQTINRGRETHWSWAGRGAEQGTGGGLGGIVEAHSFDFFERVQFSSLYLFYLQYQLLTLLHANDNPVHTNSPHPYLPNHRPAHPPVPRRQAPALRHSSPLRLRSANPLRAARAPPTTVTVTVSVVAKHCCPLQRRDWPLAEGGRMWHSIHLRSASLGRPGGSFSRQPAPRTGTRVRRSNRTTAD